ncbi:MAG: hypothetical protein JW995_05685 [Melioribacteraceae bacterium]|nr:hypothetical protein [Melioribacteraceae bacterium]
MNTTVSRSYYTDDVTNICGEFIEHGHLIQTDMNDNKTGNMFTTKKYDTVTRDYICGGLIDSLNNYLETAFAAYKAKAGDFYIMPLFRFVTALLQIDYLKPTPPDVEVKDVSAILNKALVGNYLTPLSDTLGNIPNEPVEFSAGKYTYYTFNFSERHKYYLY